MKANYRVLIILFTIFISVSLSAQEKNVNLNWLNFKNVQENFLQKQKPILIYLYKDNCDSCKIMNDTVFGLSEVANYLNVLFYPIKLNAEAKDTITFFNGQKFAKSSDKAYHDIVYFLAGEKPIFPSLICFNKQAQGAVFPNFKDRNHIFPILIYYSEEVYLSTSYEKFEEYYFKAYPPGRKQIMTRLLIKWKTYNELAGLMKQKKKKVLIDLYYNFSTTATMMRTRTYNDPKIAQYLNEKFYNITVEAKYQDTINYKGIKYINENLSHGYHQFVIAALEGKMKFPAFIILDEELNLLNRIQMYKTPEDIEPILKYYGEDKYKNMDYKTFLKSFESSFKSEDKKKGDN